ncbi:hypothetical protein AB1Y20_015975 [Prymnesium parvum]|uniref:K Homology domain-containing protein n=1 Tax=Prymnesium parvum TaxID=97485 RepID=A0AB34K2A1_PRYPA
MRRASWISLHQCVRRWVVMMPHWACGRQAHLTIIVTRFAWIAHKLASSKRCRVVRLSDLTHDSCKWKLPDEKVCRALEFSDLTKCYGTGSGTGCKNKEQFSILLGLAAAGKAAAARTKCTRLQPDGTREIYEAGWAYQEQVLFELASADRGAQSEPSMSTEAASLLPGARLLRATFCGVLGGARRARRGSREQKAEGMDGVVEVQDVEQKCWHTARITDVSKDRVEVAFDVQGLPGPQKSWVPWEKVREVQKSAPLELKEGMQVEVNVPVDGEATWWGAQVKQVKGDFAKVHFLGGGYPDDVVDVATLRACGSGTLNRNMYLKHTMSLKDDDLLSWFQRNSKIVEDVRTKSGLLALLVESSRPAQLRLIGTEKSIGTAKMLLELHIKHQTEMARFASGRAQLANKLEAEKEKLTHGCRIEFPITRDVLGLVVGKGGKNILETKRATGIDRVDVDPEGPRVVIIGPTQQSVDAARERLEFVIERIDVKSEQVGWLIGRGGKHFKELQEKTKLTRLNVDKSLSQVVLVGTKSAVEAAILYMETHLQYLPEFETEAQRSEQLRRELRNFSISDTDAGVAPGKGQGGERNSNQSAGPRPSDGSDQRPSHGKGTGRRQADDTDQRPSLAKSSGQRQSDGTDQRPSSGKGSGQRQSDGTDQRQSSGKGGASLAAPKAAAPSKPADTSHANGRGDAGGRGTTATARGRGKGRGKGNYSTSASAAQSSTSPAAEQGSIATPPVAAPPVTEPAPSVASTPAAVPAPAAPAPGAAQQRAPKGREGSTGRAPGGRGRGKGRSTA